MEQKTKTDNKGGDGGENRGLTLADVFFFKNKRVLRKKIVHNIACFASVHQTFLVAAEEKIKIFQGSTKFICFFFIRCQGYQLPTVCDMTKSNELKMYRLMVRTSNSRWLKWVATSQVKELKLPTSITNEEMLIMFGGGEGKFSELQSLNLWGCYKITGASLAEVGRRCPNLQSLDLGDCYHINDASVMEVARGFSNLQTLDLRWCSNITDTSLGEVGRRCSNLQSLNLTRCSNITDASLREVGRGCPDLQSLNLSGCSRITSACKYLLDQSHPMLGLIKKDKEKEEKLKREQEEKSKRRQIREQERARTDLLRHKLKVGSKVVVINYGPAVITKINHSTSYAVRYDDYGDSYSSVHISQIRM